jgi:hypothetical protein
MLEQGPILPDALRHVGHGWRASGPKDGLRPVNQDEELA